MSLKRFVVKGEARLDQHPPVPYKMIVDLRGHTVIFTADTGGAITPYGVFWLFETELFRWNHRRELNGLDQNRPLLGIEGGEADDRMVATTRDAYWLAGVLHQIKEIRGFSRVLDAQFARTT